MTHLDTFLDALRLAGIDYEYFSGEGPSGDVTLTIPTTDTSSGEEGLEAVLRFTSLGVLTGAGGLST